MARQKILVVEDEDDLQELLTYNLSREGYTVHCVPDGERALQRIRNDPPNLIVLDLMLPGVGGLDVCKAAKARAETRAIPIIMLTAKSEESDVVAGLELGADDYMTKPFSMKVLIARIRNVLRRRRSNNEDGDAVVQRGDLYIHPGRHEVLVAKKSVDLTATEFQVLHYLACRPGWVFTRGQIVDAVKGEDYAVTERAVDVQMVGLRKKLGACADYIETVRGIGYRFREFE